MQIIDSYSEAYRDDALNCYSSYWKISESFQGKGIHIGIAQFYLSKVGSPTGNCYARLYLNNAIGGEGIPFGSVLAESNPVDVSTLTGSFALENFVFPTQYRMENRWYCIVFEYDGGDPNNYIKVGFVKAASKGYVGQFHGTWGGRPNSSLCFYVYGPPDVGLAGDIAGSSSLSGDASIATMTFLSGNIIPSASITGEISRNMSFAGDVSSSASCAGNLFGSVSISGDVLADSILAGEFSGLTLISGDILAESVLAGEFFGSTSISGDILSNSVLAGSFLGSLSISGDISAQASVAGNLLGSISISGGISAQASVIGEFFGSTSMSGDILSNSVLAGSFLGSVSISGDALSQALIAGELSAVEYSWLKTFVRLPDENRKIITLEERKIYMPEEKRVIKWRATQ